jgi:hypothetical protein
MFGRRAEIPRLVPSSAPVPNGWLLPAIAAPTARLGGNLDMTARATQASKIILGKDERDYLERLVRRRKVSRGEAQRAEIVLRAADGRNNPAISDAVGVARDTVRMWRDRSPNMASTVLMMCRRGAMREHSRRLRLMRPDFRRFDHRTSFRRRPCSRNNGAR